MGLDTTGFGKGSAKNDRKFSKRWQLSQPDVKKGETEKVFVCRILPPMKSLAETNKWCVFHAQHFGYSGNHPRDPNKKSAKPFGCLLVTDPKTKKVVVECPECSYINKNKTALEHRKADYVAAGKTPEEVAELLTDVTDFLSRHNRTCRWWLNVMTSDGEFGTLQLSMTTKREELAPLLSKLEDRGIDPFDLERGVWFKFTTTGVGFNKIDKVSVVEEYVNIDGEQMAKIKPAPLSQQQVNDALKICDDLSQDVVKYISVDQIAQLVECSGDLDEVDRIWGLGQRAKRVRSNGEESPMPLAATTQPINMAAPPVQQVAAPVQQIQRPIVEGKTVAVNTVPTTAPVAVNTMPAPTAIKAMPEDEFLAKFGIK